MGCGTGACQLLGCKDRTPDDGDESGKPLYEPVYGYPNEPLYPFGFGLSYTGFTITPPVLEKQEREDKIGILCKVKNVGEVPGAEVVQCYVETLCAPVVRPAKELIRFRKVFLQPGEEQKSNLRLTGKNWLFTERIWNS